MKTLAVAVLGLGLGLGATASAWSQASSTPAPAAPTGAMTHQGGMNHQAGMTHDMSAMPHGQAGAQPMGQGTLPATEPGQGAFAAIAEIVAALEADPSTDWSRVDIDALRAHLRDMNLVTIWALVETQETPEGARFIVTGPGALASDVADAARRMVLAHAQIMDGVGGWHYAATPTDDGAVLEVSVPEGDRARLEGLGFFGVLASGMHHQAHHWAMATGQNPHQ